MDSDALEMAVADMLLVITDVAMGDLSSEAEVGDDDSPVTALAMGVNTMIKALREARERDEQTRRSLAEKLATIARQNEAIRQLSTPVIEIWKDTLVLPLIGPVDATRSAEIMDALLERVAARGARAVIIDLTAVDLVETVSATHLLRVAKAVELLGAATVLTGVQPAVAQTLIGLGVDLSGVHRERTLRDGLRYCIKLLSI